MIFVVDRCYALKIALEESGDAFDSLLLHGPVSLSMHHALIWSENFLDSYNKTFTFLTAALVALFTWTLFRTARDQLVTTQKALELSERTVRITEQTMIASQRPWISVEIGLSGPLVITDKEVRVQLGFKLKNVGKSPARNVEIEPRIVSTMNKTQDDHAIAKQKKMCEDVRKIPLAENSILGHTIFPGETHTHSINTGITIEELKNSNPFDEEFNDFSLELIGYVSYRTAFNDGLHLTQFNGSIGKSNFERPDMRMAISFDDKHLAQGEYGIWMNPFIGGQAD